MSLPVILLLAIKIMPTFAERANYIGFSYYMFKIGDRSGNYGDNNRLMSYVLAADLIKQHPVLGVGTGDMQARMDSAYAAKYPTVPINARLLPHNQFLIVGLGCGIPAMLVFAVWVFMPLSRLRRNRESFFFFIVWVILFLQLMVEPVLEVQLGVFVYLFFLLLQQHQLPPVDNTPINET
jgi:O-antigen ligase